MRLKLRAVSRYRPRFFTLIVFFAVATLLVLANLSFDRGWTKGFSHKSYGWPLIWHRYIVLQVGYTFGTIGWYWSWPRLAANIGIWAVALAAPAGTCEWLLRRYRPRLNWSLRALLAAVAVVAAFCGWFAVARERATVQDAVFAAMPDHAPSVAFLRGPPAVSVQRWGPKWLDLLGVDRFRRRIISVNLIYRRHLLADNADDERLLALLARLPDLRSLSFQVDRLTPAMLATFDDMHQLRRLNVERDWVSGDEDKRIDYLPPLRMARLEELELAHMLIGEQSLAGLTSLKSLTLNGTPSGVFDDEPRAWHDCLAAVGKTTQLEHLRLSSMTIDSESLACLVGLTNLKTLRLETSRERPLLLKHLPPLPHLEALELSGEIICDDLRCLASLPRLKSLSLRKTISLTKDLGMKETSVTAAGLAQFASLQRLDELTLDSSFLSAAEEPSGISSAGLGSVLALKGLTKLHLGLSAEGGSGWVPVDLSDQLFHRDLAVLREGNPGIVIDGDPAPIHWSPRCDDRITLNEDNFPDRQATWLPASDWPSLTPAWMTAFKSNGGWARFDAAASSFSPLEDTRLNPVRF